MMLNGLYYETVLLQEIIEDLRRRLPPDWSLDRLGEEFRTRSANSRVDAVLMLTDPRGESANIIVEVKGRPLEARMVRSLLDQWQQRSLPAKGESIGAERCPGFMVVSPFLGPSAKERLADAGISYADGTGNMRFVTNRPAAFVETQGADRNPLRENVPLRALQADVAPG